MANSRLIMLVIGPECLNFWTTAAMDCEADLCSWSLKADFMIHENVLLSHHLLHHLVFDDCFSIQHLHRHALPCLRILCILHLSEGAFAYGSPQFILPHFPSRYHHSVSSSNSTLSSATLTKPPKLVQIEIQQPLVITTSFSEWLLNLKSNSLPQLS